MESPDVALSTALQICLPTAIGKARRKLVAAELEVYLCAFVHIVLLVAKFYHASSLQPTACSIPFTAQISCHKSHFWKVTNRQEWEATQSSLVTGTWGLEILFGFPFASFPISLSTGLLSLTSESKCLFLPYWSRMKSYKQGSELLDLTPS